MRDCTIYVAKTKAQISFAVLCSYREADLRLCFRICKTLVFSLGGSYHIYLTLFHVTAHMVNCL